MTATRSFLFFLFPFSLLILCLLHPSACSEGVKRGLDTVLFSALPALFPGLVLSRMIALSIPKDLTTGKRFLPFFMGVLCGFPIGAHTVTELVLAGGLSKKEGEKLLFFCNLTGPSFLILLCGSEIMGDTFYGWFLFWFQLALASLSYLLIFGWKGEAVPPHKTEVKNNASIIAVITESLSSSIHSFLYISACILFFSFLSSLLPELIPSTPVFSALLASFLELTGGSKAIGALPHRLAFPLLGFAIGFGGFSVHVQTLGIIRKAGLSSFYYFIGKGVFSVLCGLGAEIFQKCL